MIEEQSKHRMDEKEEKKKLNVVLERQEERITKFEIYIPEKGVNHLAIMRMFSNVLSQKNIEIEKLKELYNGVSHLHVDDRLGKNNIVIDGIKYLKHSTKKKHRRKISGKNSICYVYSPEAFIGRCKDSEHNLEEKKNRQGIGAYGNLEERLEIIESKLDYGIIKKSEFHEAMKPINFIDFVHDGAVYNDEVAGDDKNWDRHIKWRHNQFTKNKPDKPKYLQKFGELAGWVERDEFQDMRFKHNERPNPPNLDRSHLMVMFMENRLRSMIDWKFEYIREKVRDAGDAGWVIEMENSPWITGQSCSNRNRLSVCGIDHRLDKSS